MTILYIAIAIVVVILLWVAGSYNGFISRVNRTKEALADIDVQLKRRYDLIHTSQACSKKSLKRVLLQCR